MSEFDRFIEKNRTDAQRGANPKQNLSALVSKWPWVAFAAVVGVSFAAMALAGYAAVWVGLVLPLLALVAAAELIRSARDRMRAFGWVLAAAGPLIAIASWILATIESATRQQAWHEATLRSSDLAVLQRAIELSDRGLVPAHTVVSPWPGVFVGLAVAAFGILLLAIRRPK